MSNVFSNRLFVLVVTGVALVLSFTAWYSATAVIPELTELMSLSLSQAAWFTNSVQQGFSDTSNWPLPWCLIDVVVASRRSIAVTCLWPAIGTFQFI